MIPSTAVCGTQAAGGVPGAAVGAPSLAHFAPRHMYLPDCLHPNGLGFTKLFEALAERYFRPLQLVDVGLSQR